MIKLTDWCGSVGKGWAELLVRLEAQLMYLQVQCHVGDVKEKFGTLRVYVTLESQEPMALELANICVHHAELESARTCEECGEYGRLRSGGWLVTLCDVCNTRRKANANV